MPGKVSMAMKQKPHINNPLLKAIISGDTEAGFMYTDRHVIASLPRYMLLM